MITALLGLLASLAAVAVKVWLSMRQTPVQQAAVAQTRLQDTQAQAAQTQKVLDAETKIAAAVADGEPAADRLRDHAF